MSSLLQQNRTNLQEILDTINNLPSIGSGGVSLPELSNEGSASDLLAGKELIKGNGVKVTGTIPTKTSSDLTASGATVTVPSGYYASQATKSVATATRADTTISVSADDTNDKLTITASNNQTTGYVTGANKTATKTITLTASGANVIASDGTNSISKSVATATQATPSVSIDSAGKITATATQTAGYVSAGTKSGTKQLTTQAAKTVTPSTSSQTAVSSGVYTTGAVTVSAVPTQTKSATPSTSAQTIKPDSGKFLSQVSVAAIPSQYITTTDATASADEIMSGETAYVNGSKVTGTFSIDSELSAQDNLIAQIASALEGKAAGGSGGGGKEPCTVTFNDGFGFSLYCAYISSIDNKPKIFYVDRYDKTISAYKNDTITFIAVQSYGDSALEDMGCLVDSNISYTEFLNDDGDIVVEFLLTEDNNIIHFHDGVEI